MNVYSQYQQQQQQQQQQPSRPMSSINNTTNGMVAVTLAQNKPSMVWNGKQWVVASTTMTPNQPKQQTMTVPAPAPAVATTGTSPGTANASESSLASVPAGKKVEMYTSYYHKWNASYVKFVTMKRLDPNNTELDNHIQWAKYYSELSSQAAHYFYNNPTAITAPFQLPPEPLDDSSDTTAINNSTGTSTTTAVVAVPTSNTQKQKQLPQQDQPSSSGIGELALKRYVDRCLSQCTSQQDKDQMIRLIERMIQELLQMDQYDSMNWDVKPILQLHSFSSNASSSSNANISTLDASKIINGKIQNTSVVSNINNTMTASALNNTIQNNTYPPAYTQKPTSFSTNHSQFIITNTASNNNMTKFDQSNSSKRNADDPSGSSYNYYGPSNNGNDGVASINSRESKKQKRKKMNIFLDSTNNNNDMNNVNSTSSSGYYGPSVISNTSSSSNVAEDFISLPIGQKRTQQQQQQHNNNKNNNIGKPKNTGFNNTDVALNDRSKRFGNGGGNGNQPRTDNKGVSEFDRFMGKGTIGGGGGGGKNLIVLDEADYEKMTIKGTCEVLEKDYLRLTAPPRAELVRPLRVLQLHLQNLKDLRVKGGKLDTNNTVISRDYLWFCSQLKAIRQDCTVQRIQNAFAVDVYETHARIALEEDDLNEYNQCQTQLQELYKLYDSNSLLSSTNSDRVQALENRNEFIAYRIIYHVFLTGNKKYKGGSSDLLKIMVSLTSEQRQSSAVIHALRVREACCNVNLFDYHLFFILYTTCPNHGKYLMKHMIPMVRHTGLLRICKGYRPGNVETAFVTKELGFDTVQEGCDWLRSCNCILSADESQLVTKDCNDIQESVMDEKKSLI